MRSGCALKQQSLHQEVAYAAATKFWK